ncbi:MAG: hypothetical protein E7523_04575 [Ruminococcaceae bacterium]|nr:hypothetical protein [Oscillospiraceae bacterium]
MKNKLFRIFDSNGYLFALLVLAALAPVFSYAARATWVFVNITVNFAHFTTVLLCAMIANAITAAVLTALKIYKVKKNGNAVCETKGYKVFFVLASLFTLVFTIAAVSFFSGMCHGENKEVYTLYLQKSLPLTSVFVAVLVLALFVPKMPKKAKTAVCAIVLLITAVALIDNIFPLNPYKITSEPIVFDNGGGYSVVFSTNDQGTAYIEYTYNGEDYKVFDATGGKIHTDKRIHSMQVPYEHLKNNTYRVGTVRVIESYSYGSRLGKELISADYTLSVNEGETQEYLVLSDWHTWVERAYAATEYLGSYDAVILLGDATPGVDFEEQVISNIVQFAGELTKGAKPVLYVRGNHETRGNYASEISDALGLDEFYFTANSGPYGFIILDSGEDKDDSHPEYGGTTDYNTYRADMIKWLSGVEMRNEKVIALSHSWHISDVEPELSKAGWDELNRLGVRMLLSGHIHQCRLIGSTDGEKEFLSAYPDILAYADGGNSGGTFTGSKMTLSPDGIHLFAIDQNGEEKFNSHFAWIAE